MFATKANYDYIQRMLAEMDIKYRNIISAVPTSVVNSAIANEMSSNYLSALK
jgi:Tfp pilus assembly PilM family ATPase